MSEITCPICEQRITAEDLAGLDQAYKAHFSAVHQKEMKAQSGAPSAAAPQQPYIPDVPPTQPVKQRGGRFHQAELRREEETWVPEEKEIPPRPHGVRAWVRKSLGTDQAAQGTEEWALGYGYPTMMESADDRAAAESALAGEKVVPPKKAGGEPLMQWAEVDCPLCGERISGADEDDLSINLREHMGETHHIEPHRATISPRQ